MPKDKNDLADWKRNIDFSANQDKQENDKFNEEFKPVVEVQDEYDGEQATIGIFNIGGEIYWAEKYGIKYNRHRLIRIPKAVYEAIRNREIKEWEE